jgi:hypothetical protein
MSFITGYYLMNLIFMEISGSIRIHRESKETSFLYDHHDFASEDEIVDFIRSTPYYSLELKAFLLRPDDNAGMLATHAWIQQFMIHTELWARSDEWLYYDADYIANPEMNRAPERVELGMPVIGGSV